METEEAERQRTARTIIKADMSGSAQLKEWQRNTNKIVEEKMVTCAVARLNQENPGAEPIVVEALTKEERAALFREQHAWTTRMMKEYSKKRAAEYEASLLERMNTAPPVEEDPNKDWSEELYSSFRQKWNFAWAQEFGSFEDITRIPAMYLTDKPLPYKPALPSTVQIFAVKVAALGADLQWPLDVFGMMAVRDTMDHNRNIIFNRTRDNCQTLTEQDPYLVLTGPTRAPLYHDAPVYFEAVLRVKGDTKSQDKDLSLFGVRYYNAWAAGNSYVSREGYTSKHNTLEVTCGLVVSSIEATVAMRVFGGSWPAGLRARLTAYSASMEHEEVVLLDSRAAKVLDVAANGTVALSRRVVSVESGEELTVSAAAWRGGDQVAMRKVSLQPKDAGRSYGELDLGFCKMEVTVAWSLFLPCFSKEDFPRNPGVSGEARTSTN